MVNKNDNILTWEGTLMGPENTMYDEGIFKFEMIFPESYPLLPPKFIFTTPIILYSNYYYTTLYVHMYTWYIRVH